MRPLLHPPPRPSIWDSKYIAPYFIIGKILRILNLTVFDLIIHGDQDVTTSKREGNPRSVNTIHHWAE